MRARSVTFILLLTAGVERASAQVDSTSKVDGWLIGMSVGVPGYRSDAEPELFTIGANFTQVRPGRLGPDFSLGTMPRLFGEGVAVVGVRGGVALPLALAPHLLLLPSVGTSFIAAACSCGGGAFAGVNGGVATVLYEGSLGLRTGITWHRFQGTSEPIWLFEVGLVTIPTLR